MKELIHNIGKKKLFIILGSIVGIIVVIIVGLLLYNAFFATNSYSSIENKVLQAAKNYYHDNEKLLPKNLNDQVSINSTTLTSGDYLKSLDELAPEGVTCTATVTVTNVNGEYRYAPKLKCGTAYETKTLSESVRENNPTVVTGQGLYQINGELVFRGENPNNNVSFGGYNWKIVKIKNDQIVLIFDNKLERIVWDNRYNADRNSNDGINDYSVSRINDYLTNLYNGDTFLNKENKLLVTAHNLYIGKRDLEVQYNDGSLEKSEILENKYLGLLPLYDYINASLDTNCNSATTSSCANYNYLSIYDYNWWTATAESTNTFRVYRVSIDGSIENMRATSYGYARPVFYLAKDAIYVSGDGTKENPYVFK